QIDDILPVDAKEVFRVQHAIEGVQVIVHRKSPTFKCTGVSCFVLTVAVGNIFYAQCFNMFTEAYHKTLFITRESWFNRRCLLRTVKKFPESVQLAERLF